ncbi:MAG: hypothetical protein FWF91_01635 [Coriobacteriia bacterium]|nr:hypothetical protein [Coriobacteriia bacterium]
MMYTRYSGTGKYEQNAKQGKSRIDGVVIFPGGSFDELSINGVCTSEGPIEANLIDIDGVFTASSDIRADSIDFDGVVTIHGNLRVKKADVDGVVTVRGVKVEADYIKCDGILTAESQVSADVIEAEGFINAREIVGDRITIRSFRKAGLFKFVMKVREAFTDKDFSRVDLIEATRIELRGVRAKTVSGQDIIIGPACIIDRVDCTGTLSVDPDATVREIIGVVPNQ